MDTCKFNIWGIDSPCSKCYADPLTCAHDSIFNSNVRNFLIVTLNITDRCNDSCEHCWHKVTLNTLGESRKDMEKEDIDALWNYLDNSMYSKYSIIYSMIGGEPLLRPDIIDYAMQKAIDSRGKCSTRIYTNGVTGLDEIEFLKMKHRNIKLQVSLPVHSRPELLSIRKKNIERYIKLQNRINIVFSLAITEGNINDVIDIIDECKSKGIQEMSLNYDLRNIPISDSNITYGKLLNIFRHCRDITDENFCVVELDAGEPETIMAPFNPNNFIVEYDSTRNFYLTHFTKSTSIGNVNDGIDVTNLRKIFSTSPCIGCEHMKICNAKFIPAFITEDLKYISYDSVCLFNRAVYSVIKMNPKV